MYIYIYTMYIYNDNDNNDNNRQTSVALERLSAGTAGTPQAAGKLELSEAYKRGRIKKKNMITSVLEG